MRLKQSLRPFFYSATPVCALRCPQQSQIIFTDLTRSTTQIELLREIDRLNDDPNVHGIIVQMPLDTEAVIDSHLVSLLF